MSEVESHSYKHMLVRNQVLYCSHYIFTAKKLYIIHSLKSKHMFINLLHSWNYFF